MDKKAFFKLSYGLYIVCSQSGEKRSGCVVNTLAQVTSTPARLSVAINKDNYTAELVHESGYFTGAVIGKDSDMKQVGRFGFFSGRDTDKFEDIPYGHDENGIPYPVNHIVARFSCKVMQEVDLGSHILFIGDVTETEIMRPSEEPMTYTYYHEVKKGKTPKNAPSYKGDEPAAPAPAPKEVPAEKPAEKPAEPASETWRCTVCGYIHEGPLPADFSCPICGVGADMFEKVE